MVIFRWLSLVLVVIAVMLLGADLVGTLEKKGVVIRTLNDVFVLFSFDAKAVLFEAVPSFVYTIAAVFLDWPGWLIMAFWGFVFAVIAPPSLKGVRPLPPPPPIPR